MHVLMIFLDGIGIGHADPDRNPFFNGYYPTLRALLGGEMPSRNNGWIESRHAVVVPTRATLRTHGLPQSGTGQASLYTGRNCARLIGKHFGPYLYSTLKPVVKEKNIFSSIRRILGEESCALANAFPQRFFDYVAHGHGRTVAGVYAAMQAGLSLRTIDHLRNGTGISTDITGERWRSIGHADAPVITPYEAGKRLATVAHRHRFTLYEYFQTDKAGHERNMSSAVAILTQFDEMIAGVFDHVAPSQSLVCITSDHGNMEDLSTKSHTRNRVPTIFLGKGRNHIADRIRSIEHIAPALLRLLST